jgi:hypothetical protein
MWMGNLRNVKKKIVFSPLMLGYALSNHCLKWWHKSGSHHCLFPSHCIVAISTIGWERCSHLNLWLGKPFPFSFILCDLPLSFHPHNSPKLPSSRFCCPFNYRICILQCASLHNTIMKPKDLQLDHLWRFRGLRFMICAQVESSSSSLKLTIQSFMKIWIQWLWNWIHVL